MLALLLFMVPSRLQLLTGTNSPEPPTLATWKAATAGTFYGTALAPPASSWDGD